MSPRVTIIIITYNSRAIVGGALEAAIRSRQRGLAEIIVVDNASADGTADYVRSEFPAATPIESGGNLGYGRGCNIGLRHATTPYVLFQNPDSVLEPDELEKLVRFLDERPAAALVAPAIVEGGGDLQNAGRLPTPINVLAIAAGWRIWGDRRRPIKPGEEPFQTDWLGGALLMGRRELLLQVGGFDPRFFLYFEETDLCKRVGGHGHQLWAVGQAVARHQVHASARSTGKLLVGGCIAEHYYKSRFYYLVKHHGWLPAMAAETGEWALLALRRVWYALCRRSSNDLSARFRSPFLTLPPEPS